MNRAGFTLIELVVVIVILGIMAAVAVLSLGGTTDRYQLSQAELVWQSFDAQARRHARTSHRTIEATIQRSRGQLQIDSLSKTFQIPSSVEIKKVRVHHRGAGRSQIDLQFDREGTSPTYAVQLQRGKLTKWLVVLGISGQVCTFDTEREVNEVLAL
jgi:prepilin-type N-terminal cleavage/methylation domain-containing protein